MTLADAVLNELGIRWWFDGRLPRLDDRRLQHDRVHARCCGFVGGRLIRLGWEVRHEVEVGSGRNRGWIDLLAFRKRDGGLFCPEVKTELHDAGAVQRTLGWYESESWTAAKRFGWRPRRLVSGLLLLCTQENDERVAENRELLRQAFPAPARALRAWLEDPSAPRPARSISMIDPRSRRHEWLQPTRTDGRRSPAKYRNYAEIAAMLG